MNHVVIAQLLRNFYSAPLKDKVIIASVINYAIHKDDRIIEEFKKVWAKAIKLEIDLENIVTLYKQGLADYTDIIDDYADVAEFVVRALAQALGGSSGQ